ncbi:MAG TPA: ribonuclease P protein component [Candidatus Saccharimonadales bacterium]|nr:ribonuclease P protein component [Candidatus Saccharimonadales bacterium]
MISRTHRFHGLNSLSFVYKHGTTVRGPFFSVKTALNNRRHTYRVAVVVSRKVHKSAVARNRIRRRLYEAVRNIEDDIAGPYDIVLSVFNAELTEVSPAALAQLLKKQLGTAGVLAHRVKSESKA